MFVAIRELRRSKGKFTLLGAAVGLLVLLLLFFQAVAGSLVLGLTGSVEQSTADVVVYSARARQNPNASVVPRDAVQDVQAVDGVAEAAAVGQTVFAASSPDGDVDVAILGVAAGGPGLPRTLSEGREPASAGEAVFSGSSFDAAARIGASFDLAETGTTLEVVGLAEDAAANVLPTLYTTFETYTAAVEARTGRSAPVTQVAVRAADGTDPAVLAARITQQVAGVEALERGAAVDALPGVSTITRSFGILYLLLYVVVAIVTGVFFLIITVQKRDSLVLLRAVGARRRDVVKPVLLQVVVVIGIGVAVGVGLAVGLLAAARDVFGATVDPSTAAGTSAAMLVLGLLAASGAVRRVLAIEPFEAVAGQEL